MNGGAAMRHMQMASRAIEVVARATSANSPDTTKLEALVQNFRRILKARGSHAVCFDEATNWRAMRHDFGTMTMAHLEKVNQRQSEAWPNGLE